jgi:hypothetical protein
MPTQPDRLVLIPMRTFAHKILKKQYPPDADGYIHLRENTFAGKCLEAIQTELPFYPDLPKLAYEQVPFKVSQHLWQTRRYWASSALYKQGAFYERAALTIMMAWLDSAVANGISKQTCIDNLYKHFDISEWDYAQESLLRLYSNLRTTTPR